MTIENLIVFMSLMTFTITVLFVNKTYRKNKKQDIKKTQYPVGYWKDNALSARHLTWGLGCPATDIDFLLLERRGTFVSAGIEYKRETSEDIEFIIRKPGILATSRLFDKAGIPFFICQYSRFLDWYEITPINRFAKKILPEPKRLNEYNYVRFLYFIRKDTIPDDLLDKLNKDAPPNKEFSI